MTAPLKLRRYQEDASQAIANALATGLQRVAVVVATGLGKTVIFSHFSRAWLRHGRGSRGEAVVILVHRDELITQAVNKIHDVDPDLRVGRVKGKTWELDADVIVCSVQTVSRPSNLPRLNGLASLVIADECHHAAAPTWVATLEALGCFADPSDTYRRATPLVGFTATLARQDDKGLGDVFQEVVYRRGILEGIAGGHLVMPRGLAVTLDTLDLSEATVYRGDFTAESLANVLSTAGAIDQVAKAYAEHAGDKQGVVFWPTVDTAVNSANALRELGITAAHVCGETPLEERRANLAAFSRGEIQVLTNAMVLTEGWDAPRAEVCVIARPTRSPALYTQMVGRVLRPSPGKTGALVLDVVGASRDHKLATLAELTEGRVREVMDGETLADAMERTAQEDATGAEWTGGLDLEDVDLFKQSTSLWLATSAGCWFVPVHEGWVFLWPCADPDRYLVGYRPEFRFTDAGEPLRGHYVRDEPVELGYAMELAEEHALSMPRGPASLSTRTASWRKKREPASPAQIDVAKRLGIDVPGAILKRELSDLITIAKASEALDAAFLATREALTK